MSFTSLMSLATFWISSIALWSWHDGCEFMVVINGMLLAKKRCVEVDVASCFRRGSPTCSVNKWLLGERREIVGKL